MAAPFARRFEAHIAGSYQCIRLSDRQACLSDRSLRLRRDPDHTCPRPRPIFRVARAWTNAAPRLCGPWTVGGLGAGSYCLPADRYSGSARHSDFGVNPAGQHACCAGPRSGTPPVDWTANAPSWRGHRDDFTFRTHADGALAILGGKLACPLTPPSTLATRIALCYISDRRCGSHR